jgi:hypothetical protein
MEPYRSFYPQSDLWLEETGKVAGRVISLPNGTAVDENTIGMICDLLRHAVHHANRIPSG